MSVAARYYDVGRLAGEQAEKILVDGISAGELPDAQMTNFAIVTNMDVARKLQLFPPIDLLQIAQTVNVAAQLALAGHEACSRASPRQQRRTPPIQHKQP